MPAKSEAQRKWVYGVKGAEWAKKHHYDNPGKLPKRVAKKKTPKKSIKKRRKR